MSKLYILSFILFFNMKSLAQTGTGTIELTVQNIQFAKGGEISAGIFSKENYLKEGKQLLGQDKAVSDKELSLLFTDVPTGYYAIVTYHDIDNNKDLNKNFIGIPKEPVGFSKNAKIKFGPPSFEDAKVLVEEGKTLKLNIQLN